MILAIMVDRTKIVLGKYILVINGPELTRDPAEKERELAKEIPRKEGDKEKN